MTSKGTKKGRGRSQTTAELLDDTTRDEEVVFTKRVAASRPIAAQLPSQSQRSRYDLINYVEEDGSVSKVGRGEGEGMSVIIDS